jgi:hypothetical protein
LAVETVWTIWKKKSLLLAVEPQFLGLQRLAKPLYRLKDLKFYDCPVSTKILVTPYILIIRTKFHVICYVVRSTKHMRGQTLLIHFMHCVGGTMRNNLGLEKITLRAAVFLFIKHNLLAGILLVIAWQG